MGEFMSTYRKITRHPLTGVYSNAMWHDDYFGPHRYGVIFADDSVVYPADQVSEAELKTFWADDVMKAWEATANFEDDIKPKELLKFLAAINDAYKARWERDPKTGEGAIGWFRGLIRKHGLIGE
jgi:hypothetical protein